MGVETFSAGVLLLLGIVAFQHVGNGTLSPWLKAKFLNTAEPHKKGKTTKNKKNAAGGSSSGGAMASPLPGAPCVSGFGDNRDDGSRKHQGVDLSAPTGTVIHSPAAGRVTFASQAGGNCGGRVVVKHSNDLETRYCHLSQITAKVGQEVNAGDELGKVGATGNAKGPHLHFEVAKSGKPVDPAPIIGVSCKVGAT